MGGRWSWEVAAMSFTRPAPRFSPNLYNNDRPTWLANAHDQLDRATFDAHDWPEEIADEDARKNLFTLDLKRTANVEGQAPYTRA